MFIEQPPLLLRWIYPRAMWRMDKNEKSVYLTFDDGPIPDITPWVLDLLDKYGIKATFFMVGDNVRKHPEEFRMVVERGHRIGNHTFNHIRGFEYLSQNYLANTDKANEYLHTDLFRPPHGHMRWAQYHVLKKKYRIVMVITANILLVRKCLPKSRNMCEMALSLPFMIQLSPNLV